MLYRYLNKLIIIQSAGLGKQVVHYPVGKFCTIKYNNMEAIKCMKDMGYAFNAGGQLRRIGEDGQPGDLPFQFNISDNHDTCQAHYEELGNSITNYVYYLLESEVHLFRLPVPKDSSCGTFIFASKEYDKKDTLMILIHGSGAVRAGQWARSLIINDNLDIGSQIPYIKKAIAKDYGVMVLNTNDNFDVSGKKIPKCGTAEEHASYVWEKYVSKTKAVSIVIVAHSYGGVVTVTLANKFKKEFEKKVKAIAFTDSVHSFSFKKVPKFIKQVARNWVSSTSPLDSPVTTPDFDITRVSAGNQKHEMTSYSSMESVFKFIEEKLSIK